MKIAVAGIGYVGLSLATLLSVKNEVCALDIVSLLRKDDYYERFTDFRKDPKGQKDRRTRPSYDYSSVHRGDRGHHLLRM